MGEEKDFLPPGPVAVGDSWQTRTSELPLTLNNPIQLDSTLESVETVDGVWIATIRSVGMITDETVKTWTEGIDHPGVKEIIEQGGINIELDWQIKVEVETGLVVSTIVKEVSADNTNTASRTVTRE